MASPQNGPKDVHALWLSLDPVARARFAKTAQSTENYISNMLVYGRKWPRVPTIDRIAVACHEAGMTTSAEEVVVWFYRRHSAAIAQAKARRTRRIRAKRSAARA